MSYEQIKVSLDGGKTFQDVDPDTGVIVKIENVVMTTILDGSPPAYGEVKTYFDSNGVLQIIRDDSGYIPRISRSFHEYAKRIRITWARNQR
jgi:hypothetical protein